VITRAAIRSLLEAGLIKVTPDPVKIGPNSIDLRMGDKLQTYHPTKNRVGVLDPVNGGMFLALDPANPPPLVDVPFAKGDQWLLVPGQFYLGCTMEETYCRGVVPHLDGRSTCGRLSIEAHKTAGVGDNGFKGRWTLELEATEPVLVGPGDRLFQIYFTPAWGEGLALAITSMLGGYTATIDATLHVSGGGVLPDGEARDYAPLLEMHDLYGAKGEHHYQGSEKIRGAAPLD
jgi:deoxycytidine triphosphate deaminase